MQQQFKDIIANLPAHSKLYLSNFTPVELYEYAYQKRLTVKLLPSTLQGLIDTRAMKAFDPDENAVIISWPFFHNETHNSSLSALQKSHHFTLYTISPLPLYNNQNIQEIFTKELSHSVDLDLGPINTSDVFIVYLRPHMFCPKEGIIDALRDKGVQFHTNLPALFDQECFQLEKRFHMSAYECRLSFIALHCNIPKEMATTSSQTLLEILQTHSLRRCSF